MNKKTNHKKKKKIKNLGTKIMALFMLLIMVASFIAGIIAYLWIDYTHCIAYFFINNINNIKDKTTDITPSNK